MHDSTRSNEDHDSAFIAACCGSFLRTRPKPETTTAPLLAMVLGIGGTAETHSVRQLG